jgi:hypothetical protein
LAKVGVTLVKHVAADAEDCSAALRPPTVNDIANTRRATLRDTRPSILIFTRRKPLQYRKLVKVCA